jgi:AcrR family transcriptional regulator
MLDLRSQTPKGQRARSRILAAAEALFVTHGFHGTSVRDIAAGAELPLATIVYHFARKEQVYAAVLEAIADELVRELDALEGDAVAKVEGFATALVRWTVRRPGRVQLLLRELLDNPSRVARASQFPLASFLKRASELVAAARVNDQTPELVVLHLVGAVSYVVAAWPTVERIVGRTRARQIAEASEAEALAFARRVLGLVKDPHEPRTSATARPPRARSRRAQNDGHRRGSELPAGGRVRRRGATRARGRQAVSRLSARDRP